MAITKIQSESLNLADTYAFTGTVTGAGGVNTPYFSARTGGNQNPSDNVATKIDFTSELLDSDNYYDTTNKRFTPQVAGKYYISVQVFLSSNTTSNLKTAIVGIYKNGSEVIRADNYYATNYVDSGYFIVEKIIDFNGSSDYVEAYATIDTVSGSGMTIYSSNSRNLFQGYKIIE